MMTGRSVAQLLVVGELNPDIVVAGVPAPTSTADQVEQVVASTSMTLGSSAAITATAAARAGASVALVAVVGDDVFGRLCQDWVVAAGVDAGLVRIDSELPTGSTVVLVDAEDPSRRRMLTHHGTMASLTVEDVDLVRAPNARHVHVSSFFMHLGARERLHEVFAEARGRAMTTSLDTNDDPDDRWISGAPEMLPVTDVLFCNEREALGLAGERELTIATGALLDRLAVGPDPRFPAVILKQGALGARVLTRFADVSVAAATVPVVDTVGAGDTLAGTVLAQLLRGAEWPDALRLGVAAASLSTTAAGGTTATYDQVRVRDVAATLALSQTLSSSASAMRTAP